MTRTTWAAVLACLALLTALLSAQDAPARAIAGVWNGSPAPALLPVAPMTSAGQALFDEAKPMWGPRSVPVGESNDPLVTCDPLGFPRAILHELRGMEFVVAPDKVVQLLQYQHTFREIWTDGRALPADVGGTSADSPDPRRYGYSVGRWLEDGTFLVETVGATESGWGDEYGHPHGLGARIEERYRRKGDTLEVEVTITDPEMYQKPFVAARHVLTRGTRPLDEQLCIPSEAQTYLELVGRPAAQPK